MATGAVKVHVTVDIRRTQAAFERLKVAVEEAAKIAVEECARDTKLAAIRLMGPVHPKGTPGAPADAPPWRVSRSLSLSLNASRAYISGVDSWAAYAGPTGIVYGRAQELGRASRGRYPYTHINPHPYLKPARDSLMTHYEDVFRSYFADAIRTA